MSIERHAKVGDTVKIEFTGRYEDGEEFDSSLNKKPLSFKISANEVIQGIEEAVIGMKVNQEKTVYINSDKAYGPIEKELIITINKDQLPDGIKLKLGQELEIPNEEGKPQNVRVTKITDDQIELDGNHPLAGKNLIFEIKLLDIKLENYSDSSSFLSFS